MNEKSKYDLFVEELQTKHPRSFRNVYCGISIDEGWFHIIKALMENIDSHIKWKRDTRARDLRRNRAIPKGREAVLKFLCNGRPPAAWQEERVDEIMNAGIIEPTKKINYISVHQIKEKFGGLRFYYDGGDDNVFGMVRMAESWAAYTCESCGQLGKARSGGWIRTLCDHHEHEYQARIKAEREKYGD